MPKVIVTLEFSSPEDAGAFLSSATARAEAPAVLAVKEVASPQYVVTKEVASPQVFEQPQPVVEKPAEQPAPAAPACAYEDVTAAFTAYVQRGGGRTAATGMAILKHHGLARLRDAKPEQWLVLKRAFDTAGPEMPMGEAA